MHDVTVALILPFTGGVGSLALCATGVPSTAGHPQGIPGLAGVDVRVEDVAE
jgi:hypothetical protein